VVSNSTTAIIDYSKEPFVEEQDLTKIDFLNDGTYTRETAARIRMQSDAGVQRFGTLTFSYQSATEDINVDYVRVLKTDGTVIPTPNDGIQDMPAEITRQAPFYSDLREKHVAVKGLGVGDVLEMRVEWRCTKPLVPGQFWYSFNFSRGFVILHQQILMTTPQDRAIKWKSTEVKPVITEDGKRRTYAWTYSMLEHVSAEEQKRQQEEQTYQLARGKLPSPDVQISTFQRWDEIGAWYSKLQSERVRPSNDVRLKALELVKGAQDEDAKLRAIYSYVSTQFRYIGIAFGIGRYQPHSASEVLANQYGDCKDKHTLLASLLDAAGIKAYPALINSTHALDPDVPSPSQFDHVITAIPRGNGFLWLDTTAEVAPYGYLVSPLWDKQSLVIPSDKAAALVACRKDNDSATNVGADAFVRPAKRSEA
jgi:transglutaminase-like putative cysteine protease